MTNASSSPDVCVSRCHSRTSCLPFAANSGTCRATGSLSRRWPRSTRRIRLVAKIGLVIDAIRKIESVATGPNASTRTTSSEVATASTPEASAPLATPAATAA